MRINHNVGALNSWMIFNKKGGEVSKSLEKLSSGERINRASDDAAGLSISEKMRSQIRGLHQAGRNAQDAISMIQTAEAAARSVHDMLQRARELAVQSANGTLTDEDRANLSSELSQIKSQIDNVANTTAFNTLKMLNKSSSGTSQTVIDDLKSKVPLWVDDALSAVSSRLGLALPAGKDMTVKFYSDPTETRAAYMGTNGVTLELGLNLSKLLDGSGQVIAGSSGGQFDTVIAHEITHALQYTQMASILGGGLGNDEMWFVEGLATAMQGGNGFMASLGGNSNASVNLLAAFGGGAADYASAYAAVKTLHEITVGGIKAFVDRMEAGDTLDQAFANTVQQNQGELGAGVLDFNDAASFINWFNTNANVDTYLNGSTDFSVGEGAILGAAAGDSSGANQDATIANDGVIDNPGVFNITFVEEAKNFVFQVGANPYETLEMSTVDISSSGIGISSANIATGQEAEQAIGIFDAAIKKVSGYRSTFGALQNRLEHTVTNLTNAEENLTAAESRIRDVDMAREMMNFTKDNILMQSAQSMLAQANQQPQAVLRLLQ